MKQINLENNPAALVKELQVFQLFVNRIAEQNQDEIGPCMEKENSGSAEISAVRGKIEEIISHPDFFEMIKGVPRILGFTYTNKIAEIKMESCGDSV